MVKTNRFFGSVLLIAGTSIGAAMLALPIKSGFAGFFPSIAALPILWLFFLITAFLILDVNLSIEGETNMVSMAEKTLGIVGKVVCWVVYLLLLYSLTSAYISGSAPVFSEFFKWSTGLNLPEWISPLLIIGFFGTFVYHGTKWVDYINRFFMIGLAITYFMIVVFGPSQINTKLLSHYDPKAILVAIPLLFTSFGYHIIIPSLTTYERHNTSKLRLTILVGSLIPLLVYFLWEFFVMGLVPLSGSENSLVQAFNEGAPSTKPLVQLINHPVAELGARFLAFFAIVTSFLGVSLSLRDFLRDGLKLKSGKKGRLMACVLTFAPPLIFVLSYPRAFIIALQYAGLFVAILLGILPALMAWKLKKYKNFFGRSLLITIILGSLFAIVLEFLDEGGVLNHFIEPYLG
ncbi:MAG: aromatic amino acid transport family protein [Chlamydiota bacterium]|jgi:tyrosine-specific transport protein